MAYDVDSMAWSVASMFMTGRVSTAPCLVVCTPLSLTWHRLCDYLTLCNIINNLASIHIPLVNGICVS